MLSSDAAGVMRLSSRMRRISPQISFSSFSTFPRYDLICALFASWFFTRSLSSIEDRMRHDARRAPMTFLYPTDSRLRSSI